MPYEHYIKTAMAALTQKPQPHGYAFDAFILDEEARTLQREGEAVALTPRAFEMLLVLLRRAGEPLSKEDLLTQVWPDAFVEEANLAVHISMLRKTLGERPGGGQYIETLPRRGYRFAAAVRELDEALPHGDLQTLPPDAAEPPSPTPVSPAIMTAPRFAGGPPAIRGFVNYIIKHKSALAAVTVLAAVALAGLAYLTMARKPAARGAGAIHKLAVLPFIYDGPGGERYDFGFALADSVINKLGVVSALIVVPTTYVEKYARPDVDPKQAAKELGVGFLLMGRYLMDGDDVTVTAELIDIENDAKLWSESVKVKSDKLIELQDYVALKVVQGLQLQLNEKEDKRLKRTVPVDPRAYANFAKSRYLMSTNNHREAIKLLTEAVQIDQNFALGWAYLARAYHINALQFSGDRKDLLDAEAYFQQALALDPDQPEARLMYAKLLTETGRVEDAATHLVALLADNPNLGEAHWELSYAYRYAGLLSESIAEGERAMQLDTRLQSHQFNSYLYNAQYDKFLNSLPLQESAYVMFYRGLAYTYLNDLDRATFAFDRAYDLNNDSVITQIGRAWRLAIEGKKSDGLKLLETAEARMTKAGIGDGEIAYKFAQAYDALDHRQAALQSLNRSIEQGFFCYPYFASDPLLKNLRGMPEFAVALEKARQRHDAFRRKMIEAGASSPQS